MRVARVEDIDARDTEAAAAVLRERDASERRAILRALAARASAASVPALSPGAHAQPRSRVSRIGFVNVGPEEPNATNVAAFREGMRELGYVEGVNLSIDFFWGRNRSESLPGLVAEMLSHKPDVVLSTGGQQTVRAVKAATSIVPVVFITGDASQEGIVSNYARPEGNLTGICALASSTDAQRVQLLRDLLPKAKTVAVLWNPEAPGVRSAHDETQDAAARLGFRLDWIAARNDAEIERALAAIPLQGTDALLVLADPVLGFRRRRIVEFANANRMPGMYFWREFVQDGGLISYGTHLTALYRRAAAFVDKILKGAKPFQLVVEQPTTFGLVLNLRTAAALNIDVPKSVMLRADLVP